MLSSLFITYDEELVNIPVEQSKLIAISYLPRGNEVQCNNGCFIEITQEMFDNRAETFQRFNNCIIITSRYCTAVPGASVSVSLAFNQQ